MPERDVCDRARQALEGVTPGPWEASYNPMDTSYPADYYTVITEREGDHIAEVDDEKRAEEHEGPHGKFGRDAHFIAAARTLVPELVAEVERLRANQRHEELEAHLGKAAASQDRIYRHMPGSHNGRY
jgi:hypothetical protein